MNLQEDARTFEIGVKAFLRNTADKYLILKRAKPYQGEDFCRWDIPGGRINPGEPLMEALQREIQEETGMFVKTDASKTLAAQDILRVKTKHTVRITFLVLCQSNQPITLAPKEHTEFAWVNINQLKKKRHDSYLTPVIKMLA